MKYTLQKKTTFRWLWVVFFITSVLLGFAYTEQKKYEIVENKFTNLLIGDWSEIINTNNNLTVKQDNTISYYTTSKIVDVPSFENLYTNINEGFNIIDGPVIEINGEYKISYILYNKNEERFIAKSFFFFDPIVKDNIDNTNIDFFSQADLIVIERKDNRIILKGFPTTNPDDFSKDYLFLLQKQL